MHFFLSVHLILVCKMVWVSLPPTPPPHTFKHENWIFPLSTQRLAYIVRNFIEIYLLLGNEFSFGPYLVNMGLERALTVPGNYISGALVFSVDSTLIGKRGRMFRAGEARGARMKSQLDTMEAYQFSPTCISKVHYDTEKSLTVEWTVLIIP